MSEQTYPRPPVLQAYSIQCESPCSQTNEDFTANPNQEYVGTQETSYAQSFMSQYGPPPTQPAGPVSITPEKPVLESHISQVSSSVTEESKPAKSYLLSQRDDFLLDWALKILGVASAILFGIWAPISYKITADGNAGNDAGQASLMSEISSMKEEAAAAATAQASAALVISKVQAQLDNVGLIWAWNFCEGRTAEVCAEITSSASIIEALASLGGFAASASSTSTAQDSTPAPSGISHGPSKSSGSSLSKDILAIILGSVFGGIVIIGLVVGMLAKRRNLHKVTEGNES